MSTNGTAGGDRQKGKTGKPNTPQVPQNPPKVLSHIHPLHLDECIGGAQGQFASVSILEPVMRIERSRPAGPSAHSKSTYRVILHFVVQFSINGFDRTPLSKHNRIFDSITLRYLYRNGERHTILPPGDTIASDIQVTNEAGVSVDGQLGLSTINGQPTPSMVVHAQNETKVTYERKLRSWRKGLSYEPYPPPPEPSSSKGPLRSLLGLPAASSTLPASYSYFTVSSRHKTECGCEPSRPRRGRPPHHNHCQYRVSRRRPYNRSAHWSGQTEAQLHLWTPEIYGMINVPITVSRELDAGEIDRILDSRDPPSQRDTHTLRRVLHFDFDIETRLREIGWRFLDAFRPSSQPAEIRARNDAGRPLPPDRATFCISCCAENIHWPERETRNLQNEAEEQIVRFGYMRRLATPEEYERQQNDEDPRGRRASWSWEGSDGGRQLGSRGRQSYPPSQDPTRSSSAGPPSYAARRRVAFSPNNRLRTFRLNRSKSPPRRRVEFVDMPEMPGDERRPSPSLPLSEYLDLDSADGDCSSGGPPSASRESGSRGSSYRSPVLSHRERRARSRRSDTNAYAPPSSAGYSSRESGDGWSGGFDFLAT